MDAEQIRELYARVEVVVGDRWISRGRYRGLSLFDAFRMTLFFLRSNGSQAMISELFGISQPTVSPTIAFLRPLITVACEPEVEQRRDYVHHKGVSLLDGTFIPTWNWRTEQGLYSGKHHRHGMNLQVATDEQGLLFTLGQPPPGSVHDTKAYRLSGIQQSLPPIIRADLGYYGTKAHTPIKKPHYRPLTPVEKNINKEHSRYRWPIEQTISHLKNWKILSTRYRGPLHQLHPNNPRPRNIQNNLAKPHMNNLRYT